MAERDRTFEDIVHDYPGGPQNLELALKDPNFARDFYGFLDECVTRQAGILRYVSEFADLKPWKTIQTVVYPNITALRAAIIGAGSQIGHWTDHILNRITLSTEPATIEFYQATVAGIRFPNGTTWENIWNQLDILGFRKCEAEDGPQLRIQYLDQPEGEWLTMVMDSIAGPGGYLHVFGVGRDSNSLWLHAPYGRPGHFCNISDRLVFRRK